MARLLQRGISVKIELRGLTETLHGTERFTRAFLDEAEKLVGRHAIGVESTAKILCTAVDTGHLRRSIHSIFSKGKAKGDFEADVGTNIRYAAFMELGTARRGRATAMHIPKGYVHGTKHWPPPKALEPWVRRKFRTSLPKVYGKKGTALRQTSQAIRENEIQTIAFFVARAIGARGGLAARPYLYPALVAQETPFSRDVFTLFRKSGMRSGLRPVRGGGGP